MEVESETQLIEVVREARETKRSLEIIGHGTKRAFGRPASGEKLDVSRLSGVVTYEPEELILTVKPGTTSLEIEDVLARRNQRLGFEPPEWGPLFGVSGASTIGGNVSADASGPARVRYGAARDQLLGIRAVNGFGESFKAGGRVVKNVTGFDIPKLACGAFGTLFVLTELTFRVFPRSAHQTVLAVHDVVPERGLDLLRRAWSSPLEPTALVYIPSGLKVGSLSHTSGTALIRLEGAKGPLGEKIDALRSLFAVAVDEAEDGVTLMSAVANGTAFIGTSDEIWHVHVPPAAAGSIVRALGHSNWLADWAGARLWVGTSDANAGDALKSAARLARGSAVLVRAEVQRRAAAPAFAPEDPERAAITRAVKEAFDPLGLFNPGRMFEGI